VRSPGSTKISTLKFLSGWELFNLLSIIGKRFQDAGLRDFSGTESGIIAEGSVSGVLEGDVQFEFTSAYTRPYCKKVTGCYISMQFII